MGLKKEKKMVFDFNTKFSVENLQKEDYNGLKP